MNTTLYSRRQVALWGGVLLLFLLPLFCSLGLWQWNKAQGKLARQTDLDSLSRETPANLPIAAANTDSLRHRRFMLTGEYDGRRQILIDNRVHQEKAGYHVVTPLRLAGSNMHVLVNRGWIPAPADRSQIPDVPPPAGPIHISGIAIVPGERFFTLGPAPSAWEPVWQNLDLRRFRTGVDYPLQPVVIQLDADAPGGYLRDWPRPDEGAERNLGYAVQWFGFALASLGIWAHFLWRRP